MTKKDARVSVRLTLGEYQKLQQIAAPLDASVSAVLRSLVRSYLEEMERFTPQTAAFPGGAS